MKLRACFVIVSFLSAMVVSTLAQTAAPNSSLVSTQIPQLIKFSGTAQDETHKPVTGVVGVTFSLYKDQQGGSPLWVEAQNVRADETGHYTVMLGSASADGVPLSLFSSAEAHWISTQISGQPEQPRILLLSVPYALKNVRWLLHNVKLPIELPTLMEAFRSMLASDKLLSLASEAQDLVVRIFSFSFHREMPKDEAGNGGGFVFDGRSLPNPGREERFKTLTGKDAPVIEYLNREESVHQFLASVLTLVDASVENYRRRGFKNLMVSFGCTGGQHRSVYLAEQLAKRLRERNGVEVMVRHLELEKMAQ